jgi:hypothetical protein
MAVQFAWQMSIVPCRSCPDETDRDHRLEVVLQRRSGDIEPLLQLADGLSGLPSAHEQPLDAQARGISEHFQVGGSIVELHAGSSLQLSVTLFLEY